MKLTDDVKQRKQKHFKQYRTAKQKLTNKENLGRFLDRSKSIDIINCDGHHHFITTITTTKSKTKLSHLSLCYHECQR